MIELGHRRPERMHVRIHQAWQNHPAFQIEQNGARTFQSQDLFVSAHQSDVITLDGHPLLDRKLPVHGHDLAVVDDQIGVSGKGRKTREQSEDENEKGCGSFHIFQRRERGTRTASWVLVSLRWTVVMAALQAGSATSKRASRCGMTRISWR